MSNGNLSKLTMRHDDDYV